LTPEAVAEQLTDLVQRRPGVVRVAVDGPPCADAAALGAALVDRLRHRGRHGVHVPADGFWRDRSLRYEYGREDVEGYLSWLDAGALRREVLDAAVAEHVYLPSLRDPATNRATRAEPVPLTDSAVVVVSGALLFGLGLPFEVTVHLAVSPAARARRTPQDEQWMLAAFDEYDTTVAPAGIADVVVKLDDPRHPAARGL